MNKPAACQKLIETNPNMEGISQFHNSMTTALNAATTKRNPTGVK